MNRRYTYDEYSDKILRLRKKIPSITITSDIISGFPGETEDDHIRTINALKELEFDGIYAFHFSARQGTKASLMKDRVSDKLQSQRLHEILLVQDKITSRKNKSLEGTIQEVLIEGPNEKDSSQLTGRTRTNKIVTIPGGTVDKGQLIKVQITKGRRHSLEGTIIQNENFSSYARL
jgi:tRNA-2-methylthio-N6-dimethylallyladenosine synthase